jgi:large subunit ribosomal protein L35Ae
MESYTGVFINYRLGMKMQYPRNGIIKVMNLEPNESGKVIGWWIGWPEKNPKLFGRITGLHGRSGNLMVRFQKGLPGQAIGTKVIIAKMKSDIRI